MHQVSEQPHTPGKAIGRLLGLSAVGFFIPISLQGKTSIPLDHMVGWLRAALGETGAGWYAMWRGQFIRWLPAAGSTA
ncbi:MAG: hypothetical protein WBH20_01905 [Oceanisphaera sp.]|uniref:hypothetical protein n=1 Tax=Oceanisphaera sp. TaxID=1929979 RepID=UPI003C76FB68